MSDILHRDDASKRTRSLTLAEHHSFTLGSSPPINFLTPDFDPSAQRTGNWSSSTTSCFATSARPILAVTKFLDSRFKLFNSGPQARHYVAQALVPESNRRSSFLLRSNVVRLLLFSREQSGFRPICALACSRICCRRWRWTRSMRSYHRRWYICRRGNISGCRKRRWVDRRVCGAILLLLKQSRRGRDRTRSTGR